MPLVKPIVNGLGNEFYRCAESGDSHCNEQNTSHQSHHEQTRKTEIDDDTGNDDNKSARGAADLHPVIRPAQKSKIRRRPPCREYEQGSRPKQYRRPSPTVKPPGRPLTRPRHRQLSLVASTAADTETVWAAIYCLPPMIRTDSLLQVLLFCLADLPEHGYRLVYMALEISSHDVHKLIQ